MPMEAQLQSDMQVVEGLLKTVQEFMELLGRKDAVYRMSEELLKYYRANGNLEYRVVPRMYAQEIREALVQNEIPFMATGDSAGNVVFMLPEDGKEFRYGKLFDEVFMHHPEFYKQLDNETWRTLAARDRVKGVVNFTFDNEMDAEMFKNKAFADGKGIVTTDTVERWTEMKTVRDGDGRVTGQEPVEQVRVTVTVREDDLIDESEYKDAVDAYIDATVSMTGAQSFARRYAVKHDQLQTKQCMDWLYGKNPVPFAIHNGADKYSDYILFRDGKCAYYTYDSVSKQWNDKVVDISSGDRDAVAKMIERHMSYIHNVRISTLNEFESFLNQSPEYIRSSYAKKQEELFKEAILPINGRMEKNGNDYLLAEHYILQIYKKRPDLADIRPDFSADFLKKIQGDMEAESAAWKADLHENMDAAIGDLLPEEEKDSLWARMEEELPKLRDETGPGAGMNVETITGSVYSETVKDALRAQGRDDRECGEVFDRIIKRAVTKKVTDPASREHALTRMEALIRRENGDRETIHGLQEQCHGLLAQLKRENPEVEPKVLLSHVTEFLKDKGLDTGRIRAAHQAFDRYEMEASRIYEKSRDYDGGGRDMDTWTGRDPDSREDRGGEA